MKVFTDRYKEADYNVYLNQVGFIEESVVFATTWLRGPDEYDHFLFHPENSRKNNLLYCVEIKEGVFTPSYKSIREFLLKMASLIDVEELSYY